MSVYVNKQHRKFTASFLFNVANGVAWSRNVNQTSFRAFYAVNPKKLDSERFLICLVLGDKLKREVTKILEACKIPLITFPFSF